MGKKAKERKEDMSELTAAKCADPNWGGIKFPKIRKACSKLQATASQNTQDAQTAQIIAAATDPNIGGGGAVGAVDGASDPNAGSSKLPLIIGGVFGALVLATIVIVVIRNRNAAAGAAPTA